MKLKQIAEKLGCRLYGDGEIDIRGVAGLGDAAPGDLTFLSNPRYSNLLGETRASAVILGEQSPAWKGAALISGNPYLDFARALELFYQPPRPPPGIHPTAVIAESAALGDGISVGAYVVIGERVRLGRNAVLHPHVTLYQDAEIGDDFVAHSHAVVREFTKIGHRVILQNGALIGTDGYGFARRGDGSHHKIPQAGIVVIEDDVEVQASACIDRAAVGETRIRRGTKIDNLVQIGHAVEVGERNIVCAQAGIAGSTTLGDDCILAGQAGVINHLKIGNRVLITAQTGVGEDIPDDRKISGSPALENRRWLRCTAVYNRLPELDRKVRRLERRLDALDEKPEKP